MSLRKVPDGPLREGFTTGTSATAAAKAAMLAICNQETIKSVNVQLPVDKKLEIQIHNCSFEESQARCSVIKDAGDDPDVTHGAEIGCQLTLTANKGITFSAGSGVGIVTLPGLELDVGEPAINPVPRKMISDAVNKILHDYDLECGVHVEIFVTNGKELAKRTLNERVGIVDGLSILGTTGIVVPYSASSYIASIEQGIDVAVANGISELVINSGARSEKFLRTKFSSLPNHAFIHYGNWIGETLKKIAESPIEKITIGIMLGKAVKLAAGHLDTHSCIASWNKEFIIGLAKESDYNETDIQQVENINTAGRLPEIFAFEQSERMYQSILKSCFEVVQPVIPKTHLDLFLISKQGEFIKYDS